jgi:hypothetical protein
MSLAIHGKRKNDRLMNADRKTESNIDRVVIEESPEQGGTTQAPSPSRGKVGMGVKPPWGSSK